MGTRNAIVKDVATGDLTDIQTAVTNNNGTFIERQNLDVVAQFPTDVDGAAFRTEIVFDTTEDFAVGAVSPFDPDNPDTTNKITVTNDIPTGTEIKFSTTDTLPGNLVADVSYFAIRVDATHIRVAPTPENAVRNAPLCIGADKDDQGSGTHTLDIGLGYTDIVWDLHPLIEQRHQNI